MNTRLIKSKLQILKIAKNSNFGIKKTLDIWHTFWSWLIRCFDMDLVLFWYGYQFCSQTEGQMHGLPADVKPVYSPFNFVEMWGIKTSIVLLMFGVDIQSQT